MRRLASRSAALTINARLERPCTRSSFALVCRLALWPGVAGLIGHQRHAIGDQIAELRADDRERRRSIFNHIVQVCDDLCRFTEGFQQLGDGIEMEGIGMAGVFLIAVGFDGKGAGIVNHALNLTRRLVDPLAADRLDCRRRAGYVGHTTFGRLGMGFDHWRVITGIALIILFAHVRQSLADSPDDLRLTPATRPVQTPDGSDGVFWRKNDPSSRPAAVDASLAPRSPFARKDWELDLGVQGFTAWGHHGSDSVVFVTADLSYFIAKDFSLGLEAGIARHHSLRTNDATSAKISPAKTMTPTTTAPTACDGAPPKPSAWPDDYFFTDQTLSLYVDAGIGYLHATDHFPDGGRADNWLIATGIGADLRLAEGCYFHLGGRFARLSGRDLFTARNLAEMPPKASNITVDFPSYGDPQYTSEIVLHDRRAIGSKRASKTAR